MNETRPCNLQKGQSDESGQISRFRLYRRCAARTARIRRRAHSRGSREWARSVANDRDDDRRRRTRRGAARRARGMARARAHLGRSARRDRRRNGDDRGRRRRARALRVLSSRRSRSRAWDGRTSARSSTSASTVRVTIAGTLAELGGATVDSLLGRPCRRCGSVRAVGARARRPFTSAVRRRPGCEGCHGSATTPST